MFSNMQDWTDIRRAVLVEGASKRSICRRYGIAHKTLQKILAWPEPPGYRQQTPRPKSKLGPHLGVIEEILATDREAPAKQRHTAKRIFERLRDEHGYSGGLTQVRVTVARLRRHAGEVFVPLAHLPGRAQFDFGSAHSTEAEGDPAANRFGGEAIRTWSRLTGAPWPDVRGERLRLYGRAHLCTGAAQLRTSPVLSSSTAAATDRACTSRPMNVSSLMQRLPVNAALPPPGVAATRANLRGEAPRRYIRSNMGSGPANGFPPCCSPWTSAIHRPLESSSARRRQTSRSARPPQHRPGEARASRYPG